MKIDFKAFVYVLMTIFNGVPFYLNAQAGRQGNHCAVQKSPFGSSMDSGKVVYIRLCSSCHPSSGLGDSILNSPLNNKTISGDKKRLIEIVIKGAHQQEEINGKIYQNVMPANPEIKDQDIADVLTYIRNSFGNKASAVKISEVKSMRSKLQ